MCSLMLIRGLPGSGKSTLAKQLLMASPGTVWVEADQYFMDADGNYNWSADKLYAAHMWCQTEARNALARGASVIVSNTFTTKKELVPYYEMIQQYGQNPTVICAQSNFGSVHNVPEDALQRMKVRFAHDLDDMNNQF